MSEIKTEIKENADGTYTITDKHSTADIVRWLVTQDSKETILYLLDEIPPQRTEQKQVSYTGNGTAGRENMTAPTGFFFQMPKAEKQEPVACGTYQEVTDTMNALWAGTLEQVQIAEEMKNKKLYTHPPQRTEPKVCCQQHDTCLEPCTPRGMHLAQRTWVGLTDDEIDKAWRSVDYTVPWEQHRIDIAKAIEAKLKEKNNG